MWFLTADEDEKLKTTSTNNLRSSWFLTDEDERVTQIVRTLGGTQESWFLTEDGLRNVKNS